MLEIKLPKNSTGGDHAPTSETQGATSTIVPEGLSTEAYNAIFAEILNKITTSSDDAYSKILELDTKLEKYKLESEKQTSKSVETIGVFSAILALLIIDVDIIKSATTFLSAILLITSLALILAIFAILIHILFSPEDKKRLTNKALWAPIITLIIFIILATIAQGVGWQWAHWG